MRRHDFLLQFQKHILAFGDGEADFANGISPLGEGGNVFRTNRSVWRGDCHLDPNIHLSPDVPVLCQFCIPRTHDGLSARVHVTRNG